MAGDVNPPADSERFALWYRLHHDRILAQCTRMLRDRAAAEDIAHETLLRAWLGRERMREEDLGAWLAVVARNLCVSQIRKQRRTVPMEVLPETAEEAADPAVILVRKETGRTVRRALSEIGDRHRRLLYLREVQEVGYEELESELGLTPGGTRAVLFRARRMLRHRLAAVGEGLGAWIAGVRIRVSEVSNRARVAMRGTEAGAAPALQAGVNFALAAVVTLSGFSGVGGGSATVAKSMDVAVGVPRAEVVGRGSSAGTFNGVVGSMTTGRQRAGESKNGAQILSAVPQAPVPPPAAHDPETQKEHIGIHVGPVDYDIYGEHHDTYLPCFTCAVKNVGFSTICLYDPRFCDADPAVD